VDKPPRAWAGVQASPTWVNAGLSSNLRAIKEPANAGQQILHHAAGPDPGARNAWDTLLARPRKRLWPNCCDAVLLDDASATRSAASANRQPARDELRA
jgi:hypothetical protein